MEIKDGDYFSYSWKIGCGPSTDPYWCRDRRCVARADSSGKIWLVDTFNHWPFKDNEYDTEIFTYKGLTRSEYCSYVTENKFDLEFICNLNDYEFVHEYSKDDYDNVVFVGYQCTKLWAKPKDSQPSKTAILKKLQRKLEEAEYKVKSGERDIDRILLEMKELENAEPKQ